MSFLTVVDISKTPEALPVHPYSFPLDPFQQHAVCAIAKDENVLVCAKTGSGKTLVGEYQIYHSLKKGKRVFYTTPIKSLSNQKFQDLKKQFSDATVGIMTGDNKFCPDSQIVIMTTEILRNLLYKKGTTTEHLGLTASISTENLDAVIFDECHYINDKDRGKVWEETMILLPKEVNMVMLSATLDHPEYLAKWLGELKEKQIHLIITDYRIVPLTHYVIDNKEPEKLITLMDAKETYFEPVYQKWLQTIDKHQLEADRYTRKVAESRSVSSGGKSIGNDCGQKVSTSSFVHRLNEMIPILQKKELLPALFFVLSRKQCEQYADKVEHTLLDSSDISAVKHIISFHLHRHMKDLEIVPQYHQMYKLLTRGIAFHHSGLLPILKEITEILFSKGYVKLMFCTETFAVGLNMPTKTVLFGGLKKYDETLGGMRMLRNDEYIQMAGRAGRRGKDDKGVVIYLPDREPVTAGEMYTMMKGARPPIYSRMDFHYDFILKTIQSSNQDEPMKWLQIMERSYWFQQRKKEISTIRQTYKELVKKMEELNVVEPYLSECAKRFELEQKMKTTVNAAKKELQRQYDTIKNKQLGPKWNKALSDFQTLQKLSKEKEQLELEISVLEGHQSSIQPAVNFLYNTGYLKHNDVMKLTRDDLNLKGILATEINEGHQILMTELYSRELCHNLSGDELVCVLACFQEHKDTDVSCELHVSQNVLEVLDHIEFIKDECMRLEESSVENSEYWKISYEMIEPMKKWMEGEHASTICSQYELFEGNFIRSVMKIANMLNEWLSMATYCQHTDQIQKILDVQQRLIRDLVVSDSLYLRM
jgi:superfamily II RNA helicase